MVIRMDLKIGIIGGGQLGKMMAQEARKLGFRILVLDPTPGCPAAGISDAQIVADFYNAEKIKELVEKSDISTYEIEHIDTSVLKELVKNGHIVHPSPEVLETIKDKSKQKQMLNRKNIPTARWKMVERDLYSEVVDFGIPAVQKSCRGGYDGRGVFVIRERQDIPKALKSDSFLEEMVDIEKELAVMVARSARGEIKCYPVVEMAFDERANICDTVIAPARVDRRIQEEASDMAASCVEALDGVGIFGIEMFLTGDGKILVNEIAPRPHNSGHYTIEACVTSQFEQHLRAIAGFPLGSTELLIPAVMVNILGEDGYEGPPHFEGVEDVLAIPGASIHIYGKKTTKPFRKMGHVTIVDKNMERALEKAETVKRKLKVKSYQKSEA
ncbi:MAG TPA: 5-(carboxyamino)imidazole ribonucleotide synthase [Thermoanaerobacterales bacterium]|nr:5-(carboxyamino)imidazole ribonucleotide synthase [Thermoanaerobacterales bacterium]